MKLIKTQNLILEQLAQNHFEAYLAMFSPFIQKILNVSDTQEEHEYLKLQYQKVQNNQTFFYCIIEAFSQQLIGALEIRSKAHRSQLYNWINEQFWGNGYYQEALLTLLPHYFKQHPEEEEVNARVDISNLRSFYALKKCGFTQTGIFKGSREDQYNLIIVKTFNVKIQNHQLP